MTGPSSLPPLKKNDGKYGLLALLLLLLAAGLWFFSDHDDPEPVAEVEAPPIEPVPREQFAEEIEIPDEDESPPEAAADKSDRAREPSTASPETTASQWVCNGTIDAAQVRSVIKGLPSKQVQTCYERGLKANNLLQGSMQVELTISGSGSVAEVYVRGSLADAQVFSCVKRVAKTWDFPKPSNGCVRINVPFQMTPKL